MYSTRAEQKAYISGVYNALLAMQQLNPEQEESTDENIRWIKRELARRKQRIAVFNAFIASGGGSLFCKANGTYVPLCKCCGEPLPPDAVKCRDCG